VCEEEKTLDATFPTSAYKKEHQVSPRCDKEICGI